MLVSHLNHYFPGVLSALLPVLAVASLTGAEGTEEGAAKELTFADLPMTDQLVRVNVPDISGSFSRYRATPLISELLAAERHLSQQRTAPESANRLPYAGLNRIRFTGSL